jgi:FtsH-binding integral membrane protein
MFCYRALEASSVSLPRAQGAVMESQLDAQQALSGSRQGPVAAEASPAERAAFITKTYVHLLGAIVAFAALEVFWFNTPVPALMFSALSGRFAWLLFMAAFVGVSMLANSWAMSSTSLGKQYAGLGLYTVCESLLFLPLIAMAMAASVGADGGEADPTVLPSAIVVTLTLFGGLTGVVFITRKDFSFMRSALLFGGFAALGLVFASLIFGFTLGLAFSYAMVALACGYILYDTSNVLHHYRTHQHVAAALALFAAVMLLFWYVLRIFLARRR